MRSFIACVLLCVTGSLALIDLRHASFNRLVKRDAQYVCGTGDTCEIACGPDYRQCVYADHCVNIKTEICCSDGTTCPNDSRCFSDDTCCPNSLSNDQCSGSPAATAPYGRSSSAAAAATTPTTPPASSPASSSAPPQGSTSYCMSVPAPATCEKSCGTGWETCVVFPNCYNPGLGQTCCADGSYCPKGETCVAGGCCKEGDNCESGGSSSAAARPSSSAVVFSSTQSKHPGVLPSPTTSAAVFTPTPHTESATPSNTPSASSPASSNPAASASATQGSDASRKLVGDVWAAVLAGIGFLAL